MRIATWNLQSNRELTPARAAAFRQTMEAVDADVWVLTDTWEGLAPSAAYRPVAQSSVAENLKPSRRHVAIWSRLEARSLPVYSDPERMACIRVEESGRRASVVVGTVLPLGNDPPLPGAVGFCAAIACQAAEWARLREIPGIGDFWVAGNFNQSLPYQPSHGSRAGAKALSQALQRHGMVCLTAGREDPLPAVAGQPHVDHICLAGNGEPPRLHPAHAWRIACVGDPLRPVTGPYGAYADLDVSR